MPSPLDRNGPSGGDDQSPVSSAAVLDALFEVIRKRQQQRPDGSYVVQLLDGGWEAISAKVTEEAAETIDAARDESDEALAREVSDLIFHVWVLLASRGVSPGAVYTELGRRFGIGGLVEKASRATASTAAKNKD